MPKHVVFDVVGTLVSYDAFFANIEKVLGPRLLANNITPKIFGFAWLESSEREFTYLSISSRYKPYKQVFSSMFYRMLWMSGIAEPRSFATDAERDEMVASYSTLVLRPGVQETFDLLRKAGFEVWALSTGDEERVLGYFKKAGVEFPKSNFRSCDAKGVAKPALDAYRPLFESFGDNEKWFAAAHYWDVSAAKIVGFKGAYCSIFEKEDCKELFDVDMDVMADTLPEMAKKIIETSKS
ncbi:2-haloalkanoic acid dehalogenase, partial [Aureobasidium melanogenum]